LNDQGIEIYFRESNRMGAEDDKSVLLPFSYSNIWKTDMQMVSMMIK
jgi:hypothetical protein